LWQIPLTLKTESGKFFSFLIKQKEEIVTLSDVNSSEWVKFNPRHTGFYRVHYSSTILHQFKSAIENSHANFSAEDRTGILSDIFSLSKSGIAPLADTLQFLSYYKNEMNYTVWLVITKIIRELEIIIVATDFYPKFKQYLHSIVVDLGAKLGWDPKQNEDHTVPMLRGLIIGLLGKCEDAAVVAEAKNRFEKFLKDNSSLNPDLRKVVYGICLASQNKKVYDELLKLYRSTTLQEEKDRIIRSLGSASDAQVLKAALNFFLSDEVRSQGKCYCRCLFDLLLLLLFLLLLLLLFLSLLLLDLLH